MIAPGTIWGVGVGPGDPELLTLKALRILRAAPVLAYPAPIEGAPRSSATPPHPCQPMAGIVRISLSPQQEPDAGRPATSSVQGIAISNRHADSSLSTAT